MGPGRNNRADHPPALLPRLHSRDSSKPGSDRSTVAGHRSSDDTGVRSPSSNSGTDSDTCAPPDPRFTGGQLGVALMGMSLRSTRLLKALCWIADGVSEGEAEDLKPLVSITRSHPEPLGEILGLHWIQDGIEFPDTAILRHLEQITGVLNEGALGLL